MNGPMGGVGPAGQPGPRGPQGKEGAAAILVHQDLKDPREVLDHEDQSETKDQRDQLDHKDLQDLQDHQPQPYSQVGHTMAEIHLNQHCATMVIDITGANQARTSRLRTLNLLEPSITICSNLMSLCKEFKNQMEVSTSLENHAK